MSITPFQRWPEIDHIFLEALNLPPERRGHYLEERCSDPALRREVEALLQAEKRSRAFFENSSPGVWVAGVDGGGYGGPGEGDIVGAYRLKRILGRGGSSTVYLADRADGEFHHDVAVKILDPSLMGRAGRDRFHQERQILADLRHPNIAGLLDGGITAGGWPYIVMEYVEAGVPIDRFCDDMRLPVRSRLSLFKTVCEAVHHAHRGLVVHRDLKPGNVLVSEDGVVKLVDFGIAKILDPGVGSEGSFETRAGFHPMTPAYAAPEQIRGDPVTTATDVYQLGSLLYHLLTGHRPFDNRVDAGSLLSRLDSDGPEPPSRVVLREVDGGAPGAAEEVAMGGEDPAAVRGTSMSGLRSQLKGDLDTLVLSAMSADPERRYASAEALAAEVDRYLEGRPLEVHPDSTAYRFSKLLRRHPFGAAMSAATTLILTAVSMGLVRQYQRAELERDKAEEVSRFLVGLFERTDPRSAASDTLTVKAVLAEGAARVTDELSQQPLVQAGVMNAIGEAYMGLGTFDDAQRLITSALEIRRRELPDDHADLGESHHNLGELLIEQRIFPDAEREFREALRIRSRSLGRGSREVAVTLGSLGLAQHAQGDFEGAGVSYERALRVYQDNGIPLDHAATQTQVNLGYLRVRQNRPEAAQDLLRSALAIRRALFGEDHASVASALSALAEPERMQGQLDSATVHVEAALAIMERLYGTESVRVVGPLITLGSILAARGELGRAEATHRRGLAVAAETLGRESPDVARILNDLSGVLRDTGELVEAVSLGREAVSTYRRVLGADHLFSAFANHTLGTALAAAGYYQEAESTFLEALRVFGVNDLGEEPQSARSLTQLGSVQLGAGRPEVAEEQIRRALSIWERQESPDSVQVASTRGYLGKSLLDQGRLEESEPVLLSAFESLRATSTAPQQVIRRIAGWLVELYERLDRPVEAARFRGSEYPS